MLDVGCGSGVLSIAAARLGFAPVVAIDNDPVAVEVTLGECGRQRRRVEARYVDALTEELPPAGLVVANVLLEPVERSWRACDADRAITSGYLAGDDAARAGVAAPSRGGSWTAGLPTSSPGTPNDRVDSTV